VGTKFEWPLQEVAYRGFATWCVTVRNLSSGTAKAYISALATAHSIAGFENVAKKPGKLTSLILAGSRNLEIIGSRKFSTRRSMNLTVLKIFGHRIANSDWSPGSKQVVWAAVTTAFFTSARMGELLSPEESNFDPNSTLLWGQVLFRKEGRITLHIRLPKIASKEGDFLDLYPFIEKNCCPVLALQRFFLMQHEAGMLNSALPVFRFPSGRALTPRCLNKILKTVLGDILKDGQDSITCHSLRSAIPTALNEAPHIASTADTKDWGRWKSDSHKAYTKQHSRHKKFLFDKISRVLSTL
jgi:integrase